MLNMGTAYVDELIAHELALRDLYGLFAEIFRARAKLWRELSMEESAHADVLRALGQKLVSGELAFTRQSFTVSDVADSRAFVDSVAGMATRKELDLKQALEKAAVIERGIIEQDFFRVFEGDDPAIRSDFEALTEHTRVHLKKILALRR